MKYVVADFESTLQKIIHSISFTAVNVIEQKAWVSHGRHRNPEYRKNRSVTHGELHTIFIKEALEDPLVAENERVQAKLGRTVIYGKTAKVLPFRDAICEFMHYVWEHGDGNWLAHAMDNELEILQATDVHFGTGLFPKPLKAFPDHSTIPGWNKLAKVCTQHVLTTRCPEFFERYTSWMTMNGWTPTKFSSRLEDFVRFVRDDREYNQQHIAPCDVTDLCEVLMEANPPLDGKSYMISTPVFAWSGTQTKTSSASSLSTPQNQTAQT
jgi:hypothetical protein